MVKLGSGMVQQIMTQRITTQRLTTQRLQDMESFPPKMVKLGSGVGGHLAKYYNLDYWIRHSFGSELFQPSDCLLQEFTYLCKVNILIIR